MSSQYGECWPTNGWDRFTSLGHPGTFQWVSRIGFVTVATSVTRGQPNFARCLAVCCAATLYIHFRGLLPHRNLVMCKIHFSSKSCILLYWQRYCTALKQQDQPNWGVVQGMELRNLRRGHHLYSAGRPSRWASAHILVIFMVALWNRADHYILSCGFFLWLLATVGGSCGHYIFVLFLLFLFLT